MNVAVSPTERSLSWRRMLLVALLCVLAPRAFAQAPDPADLAAQRAQAVTQVVLGILSYARWPVEPAQLRLCVVGPTQYTDDLIKGTTQATGRPVVVQRLLANHPDIVNACDAAARPVARGAPFHAVEPDCGPTNAASTITGPVAA